VGPLERVAVKVTAEPYVDGEADVETVNVGTAATPVADRATVSGEFGALVLTISEVAGTAPRAEGVTVSKMVQFELALRVVPHVPPEML
jgi:hypothetical protein